MDYDDPLNTEETESLLDGSTTSNATENIGFCSRFFCCRNVLVFLQFFGFITVYGMRANLSVALVAMVNQTFAEQSGDKIIQPECRRFHGNSSEDDDGTVKIFTNMKRYFEVYQSIFDGYFIFIILIILM